MELVQDHGAHPPQERVGEQLLEEHAVGLEKDAGRIAGPALEADLEAHGPAHGLAHLLGHPHGQVPRRDAPGLEHQDAPRDVQQEARHLGGLARARGRAEDERALRQRGHDGVSVGGHWERGGIHALQNS